jgi:hypothetical protein
MPLNIKDSDETPRDAGSPEPQPILHTPTEGRPSAKWGIVALFVVVLAAAVYLIYAFVLTKSGQTSYTETTQTQPAEQQLAAQPMNEPPETSSPKPSGAGQYTIFIASYLDKDPAQAEVDRWNTAGYEAFVIEANQHYRVALGEYSGVSRARQTAEQLHEAFENGYWIGMLQ